MEMIARTIYTYVNIFVHPASPKEYFCAHSPSVSKKKKKMCCIELSLNVIHLKHFCTKGNPNIRIPVYNSDATSDLEPSQLMVMMAAALVAQ